MYFLKPPSVFGLRPCSRTHLKKALWQGRPVGGKYDELENILVETIKIGYLFHTAGNYFILLMYKNFHFISQLRFGYFSFSNFSIRLQHKPSNVFVSPIAFFYFLVSKRKHRQKHHYPNSHESIFGSYTLFLETFLES